MAAQSENSFRFLGRGTSEPPALAYVGLAQFLPILCLLLPAGDLIDRFDRRRILAMSWSVSAVCSGLLWWLSGHGASGVLGMQLLQRVTAAYAAPRGSVQGSMVQRFGAGIALIRTRPIILGTISLDLFALLLGGVVALLPIYAQEVLHVGPAGLGALRSAISVGEVGVGLFLRVHPISRHVGRTMFMAVAVFGAANLVFALSHWFWLSLVALAVAGGADMVSVYIRGALVRFSTPDHIRGRVNAVNMLFIGSSNELGEFRAGTSAAWLGAVPAAIFGGICTLGVVAGWM